MARIAFETQIPRHHITTHLKENEDPSSEDDWVFESNYEIPSELTKKLVLEDQKAIKEEFMAYPMMSISREKERQGIKFKLAAASNSIAPEEKYRLVQKHLGECLKRTGLLGVFPLDSFEIINDGRYFLVRKADSFEFNGNGRRFWNFMEAYFERLKIEKEWGIDCGYRKKRRKGS